MKMRAYLALLILLAYFAPVDAQQNMSGELYDIVSQAPIESVLVVLQTNPPESTYTDNNGFFSFGPGFLSGDANGSGDVNGLDVIYLVAYFKGGPAIPPPILRADGNGSCDVNGLDVTYLVAYLKGGSSPIYCDTLISTDTARVVFEKYIDGEQQIVTYESNLLPQVFNRHYSIPTVTQDTLSWDIYSYWQLMRGWEQNGHNQRNNFEGTYLGVVINSEGWPYGQEQIDSVIAATHDALPVVTQKADGTSWITSAYLDTSIFVFDFNNPPDTLPDYFTNGMSIWYDNGIPGLGENGEFFIEGTDTLYGGWEKLNIPGVNIRTTHYSEIAGAFFGGYNENIYNVNVPGFSRWDETDACYLYSTFDSTMFKISNTRPIGNVLEMQIEGADTTWTEYDPGM